MDNENKYEQNEKYDLKNRKIKAIKLMEEYKSNNKNVKYLEHIKLLDNTLPELYLNKLRISNNDTKLRENSYNIVDKDLLKPFNINKKLNYKELYFEIINYIESITIDEQENATEKFDLEEFLISENDENEAYIGKNKNVGNNIIINVETNDINGLDENLLDSKYKNVLEKKENFDINKLLIKDERIKVKDIKKKFSEIYDVFCTFINYKNNYPDFESELFYFYSLRYMLKTYSKLKYKRFIEKLQLTDEIGPITNKIKNNEIKDELIKKLYYYIMNTQYTFDNQYIKLLMEEIDEKSKILPENCNFKIINNNLYDKNDENQIVLKNVDDYLINELINKKILLCKNRNKFIKNYYSIKGLLKYSSFNRDDGNKLWDEFLSSFIMNDIIKNMYNETNIFNQKAIIVLFKEHSNYFPNFNQSFISLSHKELFNMYFPPSNVGYSDECLHSSYALDMINKAVNKIMIQREWGHISSSYLFYSLKIKNFTTSERKNNKEQSELKNNGEIISERGKNVQMLLYGRIIDELNAKEAIFILNNKNYDLSLEQFHQKFIGLDNAKLDDVFNDAISSNPNIDICVIKAFDEYKNKDNKFKYNLQNCSFRVKLSCNMNIDLDKIKFKIGKNYHHKFKNFNNKK